MSTVGRDLPLSSTFLTMSDSDCLDKSCHSFKQGRRLFLLMEPPQINFCAFGECDRVVDVEVDAADRVLDIRVAKQYLHRP